MGTSLEVETMFDSQGAVEVPSSDIDDSPPTLKLMVPEADFSSDNSEDILQTTIESAKQIQQLAERLKQNQAEIANKEAELEASIARQHASEAKAVQSIEIKLSQLQQRTAQVRLQQRNVMQLQETLLKSHEASKIAIEQLVASEPTDATKLQNMKAIQYEVSERFDEILVRWNQLLQKLEKQQVRYQGTQGRPTQGFRDVA